MIKTKNDKAWEKLFEKQKILDEINKKGYFDIESSVIKEYREPRLMTKFDHKVNLPQIFQKNKLSILPLTRRSYRIGHYDIFKEIKDINKKIKNFQIPNNIKSIDPKNLYSETSVLHSAYATGMLHDLFNIENNDFLIPTISGRMSSKNFEFNIINQKSGKKDRIEVNNSQIEIDAGYESKNELIIIEAKNFKSEDFVIRQLYYPYRLWKSKIDKKVIPVFLNYSNDIFSFYVYEFETLEDYNSLKLIDLMRYKISSNEILEKDIVNILKTTTIKQEPNIPFPQANDFEKVVDLLGFLNDSELEQEEITLNFSFDQRQAHYYTRAAKYLNLVEKKNNKYQLTKLGNKIINSDFKDKYLSIISKILEHEVFNITLKKYFNDNNNISKNDVIKIMKKSQIYNSKTKNFEKLSESTIERRSQTVLKWIEWIVKQIYKND